MMTDDELDLLASSYLDGEATPQEMALVERDPELRRRVDEMRAVRQMMQAPTPVPGAVKEQHLATALAAFSGADRRSAVTEIGTRPAGVDDQSTGNGDSPVIQLDDPAGDDRTQE